jgi:lipopolysaccharide biosynthesis glycosyltransferase
MDVYNVRAGGRTVDAGAVEDRRIGPLLLAADSAFSVPLATSLRSLAERSPLSWPLEVHVLYDGINEEARREIAASFPLGSMVLHWHQFDLSELVRGYSTLSHVSKMTYARLVLPRLLPEDCQKALYLDGDILAFDDLWQLWSTDLEGAVLGAVTDRCLDPTGHAGLPRVKRYFNAGVLLMDLRKWRSERISERAFDYLDRHPHTPYCDQDALNAACDGRWKQLDMRWNYQCGPLEEIEGKAQSGALSIIHFVTPVKPWQPGNLSPNVAFYNSFRGRTRFVRTRGEYVKHVLKRTGYQLLEKSPTLRIFWHRTKAVAFWAGSILAKPKSGRRSKTGHKRTHDPMGQS